jgi:hypothetical protein
MAKETLMDTTTEVEPAMPDEVAKELREPFPPERVGKLPRVTCKACRDAPGRVCDRHSKNRCDECQSYMTSAHLHLDYVGHADVTDRLLEADPLWTWEPYAVADDGCPLVRRQGNTATLWINLTVAGVTRPGVGSADSGKADVEKELIGDALRNAAMRFGVALDLWRKDLPEADADVHAETERRAPEPKEGWADLAEQQQAHDAYAARAGALGDAEKEALKEWRREQGFGYPMTLAEMELANTRLDEVLGKPM